MSMISSGKIINAFLWSCFACHFYRVQHLVDILQQRAILLKKRYWEHPIYCKFPIISCYTIMSTFYRIHQQSFITFTLLHDFFQHNAKYVTYTNDITKKRLQNNHTVQMIKALLNTCDYSIIILVLSCQKKKNTNHDHLKVYSQLMNCFCSV